ncbi:MAG: type II toxin-antitoxin system RelB/DinJ family antitoxin [Roseburia sp.]|nr:type II toxin-antitoxin system RelB/DinJ family antitoxin [Roseburia sp.]
MSRTIQVKVEDDLKVKSDSLFRDLGTDTTTAIRMFLTQAVAVNGFPFEIKRQTAEANPYAPMTEEEMLAKLKKSREQGKYRDADDVISDMRSKYGL